jgi:hypothetical protein
MTRLARDVRMLSNRRSSMRAIDGAVIDPVVDEANGIQWFFKYRKNAPSLYKWFAMGEQTPLIAGSSAVGITPTPINTIVLSADVISIPFSGMYLNEMTCQLGAGSSASTESVGWYLDGGTTALGIVLVTLVVATAPQVLSGKDIAPREILASHSLQIGAQVTVLGANVGNHMFSTSPRAILV